MWLFYLNENPYEPLLCVFKQNNWWYKCEGVWSVSIGRVNLSRMLGYELYYYPHFESLTLAIDSLIQAWKWVKCFNADNLVRGMTAKAWVRVGEHTDGMPWEPFIYFYFVEKAIVVCCPLDRYCVFRCNEQKGQT